MHSVAYYQRRANHIAYRLVLICFVLYHLYVLRFYVCCINALAQCNREIVINQKKMMMITRIRSMERGICPIAAQSVTFRLPRTSDSGHMGVYYAEKVAQYAQNPKVKGLTYEDFEILRIKCFEVIMSLTSQSRDILGNVTIRLPLYDFL